MFAKKTPSWSFEEVEALVWGKPLAQALQGWPADVIANVAAEKHRQMRQAALRGGLALNAPLMQHLQSWKSHPRRSVWLLTAASSNTVALYPALSRHPAPCDLAVVGCPKENPLWWSLLASKLPEGTLLIDDQEKVRGLAVAAGFKATTPRDALTLVDTTPPRPSCPSQ